MLFNETRGALLFCPIDLTLAVSGRVIIDTVKVYSFGRVKLKKHYTMIRPKGRGVAAKFPNKSILLKKYNFGFRSIFFGPKSVYFCNFHHCFLPSDGWIGHPQKNLVTFV